MRFSQICVTLLVGGAASIASATPITFTYTGIASGAVGSSSFTGQAFTIVAQADTANITSWSLAGGGPQLTHDSASLTVNGLGTFDILSATHTWRNSNSDFGGFGLNLDVNLVNLFGAGLAGYGLDTSLGPITGASGGFQSVPFQTSGGSAYFDGGAAGGLGFTAVLAQAVPEPGSLALVAAALAGLLVRRRPA